MRHLLLLTTVLVFSGCSKEKPPTTSAEDAAAPADPAATETSDDAAAPTRFADMDHSAKQAFMAQTVLPEMKAVFASVDADRYGNADCSLCHGDAAKEGNFEMPNPNLPPLDFSPENTHNPETMKFMKEQVVPKMTELLQAEPWDGQQGFGCLSCHTMKQ